jgi:hypothetical protein
MRRTAMVVLVLASVAAAAGANPPPPNVEPPQALDLAALAKQSKTAAIAQDRLRGALVKGAPEGVVFSTALDIGGDMTAVAWSECSKTGCRGSVATLTGGAEHPKLANKAALVAPAKVFFADGFSFEVPAFADLDGDGTPEIVLHYSATEPPRAALGSVSHEYVAVYSAKDLSLIFSHELRCAGGDSEKACQWTLARSGDRLIANGQCNQRACLESTSSTGCKPNRNLLETWRKAPGQKRYTRVANPPSAPAAPPSRTQG